MKEKINITNYANLITEALPKGILLNTNGDKFNSMVIGWGHTVELKTGISSTTITHPLTAAMTCSSSRSGAMLMLWQLTGDSRISPDWAN